MSAHDTDGAPNYTLEVLVGRFFQRGPLNLMRTLLPIIVFFLLTWAANADEPVAAPRLPRDNLLVYHAPDGAILPVDTQEKWRRRREEILRGMHAIMGPLPGKEKRCPLEMKVIEEVDCGRFVRRSITYTSEPSCQVPAYLLIPKAVLAGNSIRASAALCLHPTDNIVGHGVVVGIGAGRYPAYANELANRGWVVLAPCYPLLANYQPDLKALGWESGTLKAVWDNIRGLDLLESLPCVKSGGFGVIGHSLGGHNAVFTAVFDERIRSVVSCCGFDSFIDYHGGDEKVWRPGAGWTQTRYMPRLTGYRGRLAEIPFDFHELIGALAPRNVLIIAPKNDSNFQAASVDRVVVSARRVFELHGCHERLTCEHPDGAHDFAEPMRRRAYEMLEATMR